MKKIIIAIALFAVLAAAMFSCGSPAVTPSSEDTPAAETASSSAENASNDVVLSSQTDSGENSGVESDNDNVYVEYEMSEACYHFVDHFDEEVYHEIVRAKPDHYDDLDIAELAKIMNITQIDDLYLRISIDSNDSCITVIDKQIADSEENMFASPLLGALMVPKSEVGFYTDYDELTSDFLFNNFVICMKYVKEGVNMYALQSPSGRTNYSILFCIDGVCFRVQSPVYLYKPSTGILISEQYKGSLIDYDGCTINADNLFYVLSDPTTESSALIRALKAAVANKK